MVSLGTIVLSVTLFVCVSGANFDDIKKMTENPLAHGFGEDINWVKWEDAVETSLEGSQKFTRIVVYVPVLSGINKPIFLLIHKNWCHACKNLKKTMQQSNARKAFKRLSEYFVMVNTADDDEPYEEEYRPDGKYIPRLLFLDKNGDHLVQFKNKKAEYKNYAYYYASPADILNSMKDVLQYFEIDVPEIKKGDSLKPKKPPRKDEKGPEPPKKQSKSEEAEKKTEKPIEQKPKSEEKVDKEAKTEAKKTDAKKQESKSTETKKESKSDKKSKESKSEL